MKIVVCIWSFFGGGAERVAVLLANGLAARGNEVTLYCADPEGPNLRFLSSQVRLAQPTKRGSLSYVIGLRRLIAQWRPDAIQSHQTTRNVLAILAHLTSRKSKSRAMVGVEHGEMQHTVRHVTATALRLFFWAARVLYPFADRIISVSENVRASVEQYVHPFRVRGLVLDNPVIFPELNERARQTPTHPWLQNDRKSPTLVSIGRLEDQKNYGLLIEAFRRLRENMDCRLLIFGEGSLRALHEARIIEAGLQDVVSFPGFVDNPFAALHAADLFVLSSHWEGLPTVAVEALACGVRVVSTDNSTGIREIISDARAGVVVEKDDPAALASAIRQCLTQKPERDVLPGLVERFAVDAVARVHEGLYLKLIAAKAARR